METSKNERAEKICGIRGAGKHFNNVLEAGELGYECPICKTPAFVKTPEGTEYNEITAIEFSEYNGFMWCPACNIDIPSFLCIPDKHRNTVEKITEWTDIFLHYMQEDHSRVLSIYPNPFQTYTPTGDSQETLALIDELKAEVKYWKDMTFEKAQIPLMLKQRPKKKIISNYRLRKAKRHR